MLEVVKVMIHEIECVHYWETGCQVLIFDSIENAKKFAYRLNISFLL